MKSPTIISNRSKRAFGWIGASCLLLIVPVKALRWTDQLIPSTIIGISPSILGPAGLLFLILSSTSPKLAHLTLLQTTLLVGAVAIGLEFIQLLPRPGILENVHYTFDWLDVAATLFSISLGYVLARLLIYSMRPSNE
ncbi:MAG: hypothetical protein WEB37_07520 [Bacteroidota bacterium]